LNDEGHDIGLVLVSGQDLGNLFKAFSGEDSNLVLLISGPVLEYSNEITEDVLLFIDLAHMRDLGGSYSLQKEHFLIGNI
jgi:hypothetical protein